VSGNNGELRNLRAEQSGHASSALDELFYGNLTDKQLVEVAERMSRNAAMYSASARKAVIDELRRRLLSD
jgi:hypothetical protein